MRHLKIYRAIQLIHRTGSIRSAAQASAISPSALNRAVQAFEEELSFALFQRTAGGVVLSEAGELLLHLIDRHLLEFDELQRQLGRLRDGEVGDLRISVGSDLLAGPIMDAIAEMETAHPGISLEVLSEDGIAGLKARTTHLALLTNPVTDDAVEVVHAQMLRLMGWRNGGGQGKAPSGLWDLADARVLLPGNGTGARTALSHLFRRNRIDLQKTSSLPASQVRDYLQGPGRIAVFPEVALPSEALPEGVVRLAMDFGSVQFCVLRSARAPMPRAAQLFLTLLQLRMVSTGSE